MSLPVTFYYPYPDDLAQLDDVDLNDWPFWSAAWLSRRRGWCLRTVLMLRQLGYPVELSSEVPDTGIVVLGPEREIRSRFLSASRGRRHRLFVVAIRADLLRCTFADAEIVQNGKFADDARIFHVPHWPQPGLRPRNPARGTRAERISFKGYTPNLSPEFQSAEWTQFLADRGLSLLTDVNTGGTEGTPIPWHDYRTTDIVLAVRPDMTRPYYDKPATKLVNAWQAGVPAILGPEYAYRELRNSELDYLEVQSVEETQAALRRLTDDPVLYRRMVDNGLRRSQAFCTNRIAERWGEVLFQKIQSLATARSSRVLRRLPTPVRSAMNVLAHPPSAAERSIIADTWQTRARVLLQARFRPWLGRKRREVQALLSVR